MKISLCLPVSFSVNDQKRPNMLIECLNSVLEQTHEDFEVILKDASEQPVTSHFKIAETIKNFGPKLIHHIAPDKGIFSGLNQALHQSTGDILYFICGDDRLGDKTTLSFINEQFQKKTPDKPAWMYGSVGTILEDGSEGAWDTLPFATLSETLLHNRMGQPSTFWNRAMFHRLGYFNYTLAGDYDYWCRCYRITPPMYTTRVLGIGRRWQESVSYIHAEKTEQEAISISNKHQQAYRQGQVPNYIPYEEQ